MTSIAEAVTGGTQLASTLHAGVEQISQNQTITFVQYTLRILPADGWKFWVQSNLLTPTAPKKIEGSFHYATDQRQNEDETIAINRVIFTSEKEIQDFNDISPTTIYIATFDDIRFAFTRRKSFYKQAQLWHYEGDAIYPVMEDMIIDDLSQFDQVDIIVSNSLPIWLAIATPQAWPQPTAPTFPIYPSFAVPDNIRPPYATVHINPETTMALAAAPSFDDTQSQVQLSYDNVRITLYGVRNNDALDFQRFIYQYMVDTDDMGLMDQQVMRDAKRTQSELNILAIKKVIDLQVSYLQSRVRDTAWKYILSCVPTLLIGGGYGLGNNGGVLIVLNSTGWPSAPDGLAAGSVWENGAPNGTVNVVPGITPNPSAVPVYFGRITGVQLLALGGGNIPITPGPAGSRQLWNVGGEIQIS